MRSDRTFAMIKPDAVTKGNIGTILAKINEAGFQIVAMKYTRISKDQAKKFYKTHKDQSFYDRLTDFMSSGPIVTAILEKENAVEDFRKLIGPTDPADAEEGTIRREFAESISRNAVHGSDCNENAYIEGAFYFSETEIF